ncbi:organic solute transporter alpha-like protein isoform X2 [Lycorma delicatula]
MGGLAVIILFLSYIDTVRHIMKNAPPMVKAHSSFVLSVYPVVGLATYCATIVPRSQLLAEAVTQGIFTAAMYQLFCLFVAYCGGEAELIRKAKPDSLNTRVGPCCCWPCCCCLPLLAVNKTHVRFLRVLVLQLPLVQGLIYMVLLVMWAEEESLYQVNYIYMQPVVVISILCCIWGMIMTMKMLTEVLKEHQMQGKFIVLQLVLLLAKLQGVIAKAVVNMNMMPCKPPITPTLYANLLYNSGMIWEMVLLSLIARVIYKKTVPDPSVPGELPQQICTIGMKLPQIIDKKPVESNNNSHISVRF